MSKRPFYSIVIPCYNSKQTIGTLLQSIVDQGLEKDQIQVILADDCSTEPYDEQVEPFKDKLNLVYTKTEYNFCPGNTREAGAQKATGEWMCFSDHDDEFIPGALKALKDLIIKQKEEGREFTMVSTTFLHVDPYDDDKVLQVHSGGDPSKGWTHGNFYSVDDLWKKFDIHYKKDLTSHEDIFLFSTINSLKAVEPIYTLMVPDLATYKWKRWKGSESNKTIVTDDGVTREFLEVYFIDYAIATGEVYYDILMNHGDNVDNALIECIYSSMVWYYFYVEGFVFHQGYQIMEKNLDYLKEWFDRIQRDLDITYEKVCEWVRIHADVYTDIWNRSLIATGPIIEMDSFFDFWAKIKLRRRLNITGI